VDGAFIGVDGLVETSSLKGHQREEEGIGIPFTLPINLEVKEIVAF